MSKDRIIFIYLHKSTFIVNDIKILSEKYEVKLFRFNADKKMLLPLIFIKELSFLVLYSYKTKLIISSFGGYHSWLPNLLKRIFNFKTAIIVHGTDCTSIPEINYGAFRKKILKSFLKSSYKNTDLILPVSESLIYTKNEYEPFVGEQGIKHFLPEIKTLFKIVNNGVDTKMWNPNYGINRRHNGFVSVVSGNKQLQLKGIDLILKIADHFQNSHFTIIGITNDQDDLPKNVTILPNMSQKELNEVFNKNQFYLQLSISEGFGLALAEAMYCRMIPIVSNVNFLPELIGESGYIVRQRNEKVLMSVIEEALSDTNRKTKENHAHERIKTEFNAKNRSKLLLKSLNELLIKEPN